jgi:TonB family protein
VEECEIPINGIDFQIVPPWAKAVTRLPARGGARSSALYTPEAHLAHLKGVVAMSFTVGPDGRPRDIHVKQSLGMGLDEAAVERLSQEWYSPAMMDGKLVPMELVASVPFWEDSGSDWYLGRAEFQPEDGASRPVLSKAKYPSGHGAKGHTVIHLRLTVDKEGVPQDVRANPAVDPLLGQEAIQIVSGWRFRPGQKDGTPVDVPANFDLVFGDRHSLYSAPRYRIRGLPDRLWEH